MNKYMCRSVFAFHKVNTKYAFLLFMYIGINLVSD